jgi:sarcosine oxidase
LLLWSLNHDDHARMSGDRYEVIILGLGAMGSSAAYHLAKNGNRVLGLDRFQPPHSFGSSHGKTRIIREAYFEHPSYVPLVQRAYELWFALEEESGSKLLMPTGGLMIGPPDGALVSGSKLSAEQHELEHQVLSAAELRRRFPVFEPHESTTGVWEPRAGILFPEKVIQTHLDMAVQSGAALKFNEPAIKWETDGDGVRVTTATNKYWAERLLITAGAWLGSLLNPVPA